MTALRTGLVGFGLAGQAFHGPLIRASDGLELAAVVSGDAARVHARCPGVQVVDSLEAMLADPGIDLVVVASPDHLHAEHAIAALAAGRHVVVDKPFATSVAEARSMTAAASDARRLLAVFHNRRWDADFLTLRKLVADGRLGEIVQYESHFDRFRPEALKRWKDRRPGGVWQDLGPHLVDQALVLFGLPRAVSVDLAAQKGEGLSPDYAHALLRYDRLRVILHMSQAMPDHGLRFSVHGTRGSWTKHGLDVQEAQALAGLVPGDDTWGIDRTAGRLAPVADGVVGAPLEVPNLAGNYPAFYAGVRDAIMGTGPNPVPPEQALAVMQVIEAGLISHRERREVELA